MCRSRRSSRIASMRIWSPSGSSTYRSGWARRSTRSGEPRSSAANAIAAARLPTPGGPWSRYACAGPSASAARSRRFASGCSGNVSKLSTDLDRDVSGRPAGVDGDDSPREELRELSVGTVEDDCEVSVGALDAVALLPSPLRLLHLDGEEERAVRQQPADGREIQLQHAIDADAARDSLVRER